jgi:hypothetical protein
MVIIVIVKKETKLNCYKNQVLKCLRQTQETKIKKLYSKDFLAKTFLIDFTGKDDEKQKKKQSF